MNSRTLFDLDKASTEKAKKAIATHEQALIRTIVDYIRILVEMPDFTVYNIDIWFSIGQACDGLLLPQGSRVYRVPNQTVANDVINGVLSAIRQGDKPGETVRFTVREMKGRRCGYPCDCEAVKPVFGFATIDSQ